jgi:hypothetical protein
MDDLDPSLLTLLATLDNGACSCYGRYLVARRKVGALERPVEPFRPPAVVDPVLFGIIDRVVGVGEAFGKKIVKAAWI